MQDRRHNVLYRSMDSCPVFGRISLHETGRKANTCPVGIFERLFIRYLVLIYLILGDEEYRAKSGWDSLVSQTEERLFEILTGEYTLQIYI